MKILYHHRIASKDGQFVHVEEIINALESQGHDVTVVSPNVADASEFGGDGGFVSKLKQALPKALYEIAELGYGGIIAFKLIKSILKDKPDVIYERYNLYQPVGVFIAKLFNIPILLEINAPLKLERERFSGGLGMPNIAKAIEDWTWRNADAALPVTDVLADHLRAVDVREEKIHVIHNGIRNSLIESLGEETHRNEGDPIVIGFVGFMHLTCGVEDAIELLATHKDKNVLLLCVGDGNVLPSLRARAKELGVEDKVRFTGLANREDVFGYVKQFDIALQPAVTAYASPLKMFEYMAVGSLIVAPASDNIKEILSDESAVLFDPKMPRGFKLALEHAIEDFDVLQEKRTEAMSLIEKKGFSWDANANRIVSIANDLISKE